MIQSLSDLELAEKLADCLFETDLTEAPCEEVRYDAPPCPEAKEAPWEDYCPPCRSRALVAELDRRNKPCPVCNDSRTVKKRVNGQLVDQLCSHCT